MIFGNSTGEMIDVLVENNTFKPTAYLAEDIIKILLKEKTSLNDYHTIKVIKIIERFYKFDNLGRLPQEVKYYEIHISCTHNGFMVGGSEHIEDLPQKIREMKLEKLGL